VHNLLVKIARYVDDHQPGVVACEFTDADGHLHTIIDKIPIFTRDSLGPNSHYPHPGRVHCEVLGSFLDDDGRALVRIKLERSDHIESTKGLMQFVVLESQIV
jgi:hypothetical protein